MAEPADIDPLDSPWHPAMPAAVSISAMTTCARWPRGAFARHRRRRNRYAAFRMPLRAHLANGTMTRFAVPALRFRPSGDWCEPDWGASGGHRVAPGRSDAVTKAQMSLGSSPRAATPAASCSSATKNCSFSRDVMRQSSPAVLRQRSNGVRSCLRG